jgi:hypothetical protein
LLNCCDFIFWKEIVTLSRKDYARQIRSIHASLRKKCIHNKNLVFWLALQLAMKQAISQWQGSVRASLVHALLHTTNVQVYFDKILHKVYLINSVLMDMRLCQRFNLQVLPSLTQKAQPSNWSQIFHMWKRTHNDSQGKQYRKAFIPWFFTRGWFWMILKGNNTEKPSFLGFSQGGDFGWLQWTTLKKY